MSGGDAGALGKVLVDLLGEGHVEDSPSVLNRFSMDIYEQRERPMLAICPSSTEGTSQAVAVVAGAGHPIVPRGGGISYSGGIVPELPDSVVIDTQCLDAVVEVSLEDMYVTVEAGCTWQTLHTTLQATGVRTPFWGPLSGGIATVGGTISQQASMWGSARHGPSSDSVLGLDVVIADGSVIRTGQGAFEGAKPFWRHYGPDLTGIFLADAGALGVKTAVTLQLMRQPPATAFLSFSFPDRRSLVSAMTEIARNGLTSAGFALDPLMQEHRIRRATLSQGVEAVRDMVVSSQHKLRALRRAVRIAAQGRGFLDPDEFSLHLVLEASSEAAVAEELAAVRRICAGARELDDTIPRLLFSKPYASMTSALGPEGQRWAPLNGIVALSDAEAAWDHLESFFATRRPDMNRLGVEAGFMVSTIGPAAFVLEIVITWPGPRPDYYDGLIDRSKLARYPSYEPHHETSQYISELRQDLMEAYAEFGAAHLQIGKRYPYLRTMEAETATFLSAIKRAVDPNGLMNPGALGLS